MRLWTRDYILGCKNKNNIIKHTIFCEKILTEITPPHGIKYWYTNIYKRSLFCTVYAEIECFFNFRAAAWIKTFPVTAKLTAMLPIRILIAMVITTLQICTSLVQRFRTPFGDRGLRIFNENPYFCGNSIRHAITAGFQTEYFVCGGGAVDNFGIR